jgi:hypothetical protein
MPELAALTGREAPPRRNGEMVFDAPWQGRALGLAIALARRTDLGWDAFRWGLMAAIEAEPDRPYWDSWVEALEKLAATIGAI